MVSNQRRNSLGEIGATLKAPDLVSDQQPTPVTHSRMLSSGSSQVENVT